MKTLRRILILLVPVVVCAYALWYLYNSHRELADFYTGINSHFYKAETWAELFFTPKVKSDGSLWCLLVIVVSLLWVFCAWKIPFPKIPKWKIGKKTILEYILITTGGITLSFIISRHTLYASDEVFSALNFASIPQFQCWSYYALPNNHIFYNLLNGTLFFWCNDLVASGRFLSMLSYIVLLCMTWHFLKKWLDNQWIRGMVLVVLALQFPAWGFSGQARGYEFVLLCSCAGLFTFLGYRVEKKTYLLLPHITVLVLGMITMPSFLYWWVGLILSASILMAVQKKMDWTYIKASIAGFSMIFILYLPMLTFSGLNAMTDNKYMKAGADSSFDFLAILVKQGDYFKGLFSEWFYFETLTGWVGLALLCVPVLVLFFRRKETANRPLAITYVSIVLAFLVVCVLMRSLPFYRNLIAHAYFVLLMLILSGITLLKQKILQWIFVVVCLTSSVYAAFMNYERIPYALYYYDVNGQFQVMKDCKISLKPSQTIYLDDESYYWWYVLKMQHIENPIYLNRPAFDDQDVCILPKQTAFLLDTLHYKKDMECAGFDIYFKRK